jgi:hypothetical protein
MNQRRTVGNAALRDELLELVITDHETTCRLSRGRSNTLLTTPALRREFACLCRLLCGLSAIYTRTHCQFFVVTGRYYCYHRGNIAVVGKWSGVISIDSFQLVH